MKIYSIILFILGTYISVLVAQTDDPVVNLQKEYRSFNYATVVSEANNLLKDAERFTEEKIIEISTLKAAALFAMNEKEATRKTFIEILKLDNEFELNKISYSPKLVMFFKNIKAEFLDVLKLNDEKNLEKENEKNIAKVDIHRKFNNNWNSILAKSLLLPGWGHLEIGNTTKGWILTTAGVATLGSAIYFIIDANNKEQDYLSAIPTDLINSNYDMYNKSYKIRNTLIATYAAIWIYSQIDLLFFSGDLGSDNISAYPIQNLQNINHESITLSLKIAL